MIQACRDCKVLGLRGFGFLLAFGRLGLQGFRVLSSQSRFGFSGFPGLSCLLGESFGAR